MKTYLAFIVTAILLIIPLSIRGNGNAVQVNPLQASIDQAAAGAFLIIPAGTYRGALRIDKPLTLTTLTKESTILEGSSDWDQIIISASDVHIYSLTIRNYWLALSTSESEQGISNVAIDDCIFLDDATVIGFFNVTDFRFTNNNVRIVNQQMSRLSLQKCNDTVIQNNNFTDTDVYLNQFNSGVIVADNTFRNERTRCAGGVLVQDSWNSIVIRNTFIGKRLAVLDSYNTVALPHIPSVSNNVFYMNNFLGNTVQVQTGYNASDSWTNGTHGNYWSDYKGVDLDCNGIGDTVYAIDPNNIDYFPLMTDPMPAGRMPSIQGKIYDEQKIQWLGTMYFP